MTPSRAQRFELRERLIEVLKEKPAMTRTESLPPVDRHELATTDTDELVREATARCPEARPDPRVSRADPAPCPG